MYNLIISYVLIRPNLIQEERTMKEYWPACFRRSINPISRGIRTDQLNFFVPAEKKLLILYAGSSYRKKVAFAARLKEDDGEFFCAFGDSC